ncbi:MAG: hypothetical protein ACMUIG_10440 [Thermoplasmatota archaeon]
MAGENENGEHAKKDWLTEHENIQDDLVDIKQSLLKEMMKEETNMAEAKGESSDKKSDKDQEIPHAQPISDDSIPEEERKGSDKSPLRDKDQQVERGNGASGEPTIKELLGVKPAKTQADPGSKGPRREDTSSIPKHPELTNYIARVIEHESKIKRRIFEKEKQENRMAREEQKSGIDNRGPKKEYSSEDRGKGIIGKDSGKDKKNKHDKATSKKEPEDIDSILPESLELDRNEKMEEIPATDSNIEWESDDAEKNETDSGKKKKEDETKDEKRRGDHDKKKADEPDDRSSKPERFIRLRKFFRRR